MFRSLSGFRVSTQSITAVLIVTLATLAGSTGQAQQAKRRETNANRKARIERQINETYTHRWEVGGGGGWLRFRSGEYTQRNSEIAFWMNANYYFNQKLGITGEIRGDYGNAKVPNYNQYATLVGSPQISEYPFMAGPTYRFYRRQRYDVSVFALGGTAIGKFDGDSKGIPAKRTLASGPPPTPPPQSPSAATSTSTSTPTSPSVSPPATSAPASAEHGKTTSASTWASSSASAARNNAHHSCARRWAVVTRVFITRKPQVLRLPQSLPPLCEQDTRTAVPSITTPPSPQV